MVVLIHLPLGDLICLLIYWNLWWILFPLFYSFMYLSKKQIGKPTRIDLFGGLGWLLLNGCREYGIMQLIRVIICLWWHGLCWTFFCDQESLVFIQHLQVNFECVNQSCLTMTKEWTTFSLSERPVCGVLWLWLDDSYYLQTDIDCAHRQPT